MRRRWSPTHQVHSPAIGSRPRTLCRSIPRRQRTACPLAFQVGGTSRRLYYDGAISTNHLGRLVYRDGATHVTNEVKEIGEKNSAIRTAEQTSIARFWYENAPPRRA